MKQAIKTFEIEEGSTTDMWYEIRVLFRGKVVETFRRPTMQQAVCDFEKAGYTQERQDKCIRFCGRLR